MSDAGSAHAPPRVEPPGPVTGAERVDAADVLRGCAVFGILLVNMRYVVQRAWLARYRFGPTEWAWRAFTYRSRPPMRTPDLRTAP